MDDINNTLVLFSDVLKKISDVAGDPCTCDLAAVMRDVANGVREGDIHFVSSDEWLPLVTKVVEVLSKNIGVPNLVTEKGNIGFVNIISTSRRTFTRYRDSIWETARIMDLLCNVVITRIDPNNLTALSSAWYDKALVCTMKPDADNARVCLAKATRLDPEASNRASQNKNLRNLFKSKVWTLRDGLRIAVIILAIVGAYWLTRLSPWLWIISGLTMVVGIFLLLLTVIGKWRFCPDCGKKNAVLFSWQKSTCEGCGRWF